MNWVTVGTESESPVALDCIEVAESCTQQGFAAVSMRPHGHEAVVIVLRPCALRSVAGPG